MTKALTYLAGEPGAGKSWLMEQLTAGLPYDETDSPFPFRRYDCGVTEFGKRRADFSGTDAYRMDIIRFVEPYLEGVAPGLVIAEGDRLAVKRFFTFAKDHGYDVFLYVLHGREQAAKQRLRREAASGKAAQNATWLRGRQTKVDNLSDWAEAAGFEPVFLEAGMPIDYYTELMQDPVTRALTGQPAKVPAAMEVW
jgi:hypothetical protein